MLGGYGVFGAGAYVEKAFNLSAAPPHSVVRVELDVEQLAKDLTRAKTGSVDDDEDTEEGEG